MEAALQTLVVRSRLRMTLPALKMYHCRVFCRKCNLHGRDHNPVAKVGLPLLPRPLADTDSAGLIVEPVSLFPYKCLYGAQRPGYDPPAKDVRVENVNLLPIDSKGTPNVLCNPKSFTDGTSNLGFVCKDGPYIASK